MLDRVFRWSSPDYRRGKARRSLERLCRQAGASRMHAVKLPANYFKPLNCTQLDCTQSNEVAQLLCRVVNWTRVTCLHPSASY